MSDVSDRKAVSQRKAEANRRNASRSTGPRTAKGKSWSRLNAMRHGILASQAVIATIEGRSERTMFEATVAGLAQDFQPVGTYEQLLVQEIAACFWRKRRLLMFENRAAFDAIELPASEIVNDPFVKPIPWKEPLYTSGARLTTAEQIYKEAGLDGITLPNQSDTQRVIRYEGAIRRTRERAVAELRATQKARRKGGGTHDSVAPAIDRAAAQRNTHSVQAKLLPPFFSARVWNNFATTYKDATTPATDVRELALRQAMEELENWSPENIQTKPKKVLSDRDIDQIRRHLYRAINGKDMPEAAPEEVQSTEIDAIKPPAD